MRAGCTCLIPFYNEGAKLLETLEVVSTVAEFEEIIAVDDGSTDKMDRQVVEQFPKVKLVRLEPNRGKAGAIKAGLEQVETEYVFLLDSDLHDLKAVELSNAVKKILNNPEIDLIVMKRLADAQWLGWIRHDILMSGQRVLRTEDARKVFEWEVRGYELEMAINKYMLDHQKKAYWMPITTRNSKKEKKWGYRKGIKSHIQMWRAFWGYDGVLGYLRQQVLFCREQAP